MLTQSRRKSSEMDHVETTSRPGHCSRIPNHTELYTLRLGSVVYLRIASDLQTFCETILQLTRTYCAFAKSLR